MLGLAISMALPALGPKRAAAQTFLRDAEIESTFEDLLAPVAGAAGLSAGRIDVVLLRDSSPNAFVVDSRHIFVHSGMVRRLDGPGELQAVLAHELAHIANGHLARRPANARRAGLISGIGMALGVALAAGGAGKAGAGVGAGIAGSAQNVFFGHTRAEEASADQSGLAFLAEAGGDPQAMVRVLEMFTGQEALSAPLQDPYVQTHPLSRERLRRVRAYAAARGEGGNPDPALAKRFARARAKLDAFLASPSRTLARVGRQGSADDGDAEIMARAVALHRLPDAEAAIGEIDRLLARHPRDPFLHELRGQILLESRRAGPAVAAYRRAARLAPKEPLIRAGLGRALLSLGTEAATREAREALEAARARAPADPAMLRDLAVAYARLGERARASLVTAERYALTGRISTAATHARRAAGLLARGSPGWLTAQDIITLAERQENAR